MIFFPPTLWLVILILAPGPPPTTTRRALLLPIATFDPKCAKKNFLTRISSGAVGVLARSPDVAEKYILQVAAGARPGRMWRIAFLKNRQHERAIYRRLYIGAIYRRYI